MLLYKYYPCDENTFKSLASRGLWAHRATAMNDPFECMVDINIEYGDDEFEELRRYINESPTLSSNDHLKNIAASEENRVPVNEVLGKIRKHAISEYAFCALSEIPDNILMWSHYANGHSGIVVGIDFPDDASGHLHKVEYTESPRGLNLKEWADFVAESEQEGVTRMLSNISVKGKVWEYEREWRIWRKEPMYYHYEWNQVKEVYFGVGCSDETKRIVAKLFDEVDSDTVFHFMEAKYEPLRLGS